MSRVISQTFFITGLGRSGTRFLATVLGQSEGYRVTHEWKFLPFYRDGQLQRFPIARFFLARHPLAGHRRGYGEVNSHLRRTIGVDRPGPERWIERRAIITRDPRDVVVSAMNRMKRAEANFPTICENVLTGFARLRAVRTRSPLTYQVFRFVEFTRSATALQAVVDWAGIEDVRVSEATLGQKVNTNTESWFPPFRDWAAEHRRVFDQLAEREGLGPADWTA